jgi:hypothetical protein
LEAAQKTGDQKKIADLQKKYDAIKDLRPAHDHHVDAPPAIPAPRTEAPVAARDVTPPEPQTATPKRQDTPDPTKTGGTEDRIRAVWSKLATKRADWVRLSEVREQLGNDLPREEVDKTLLAMVRTGYVHLSPDSDRKGLTQADHDSAVRIGREDKHFLAIEPEDD